MRDEETRRKESKWLSDLETLKTHHNKFKRDGQGFLIKDTKENAEKYMRVSIENSDRYVDMENEKIRKEKEAEKEKKEIIFTEEFLIKTYKEDGDMKSIKVDITKLADYLISKYYFKTIFEKRSEEIYVFNNGVYLNNGRKVIQTKSEKILGDYCTNHYTKEVEEKIKRLSAIDKNEFEHNPTDLICLENGVLNLKTKEFEKHNPKYYFKTKLPLKYNEDCKCKKIINFLKEIIYPEYLPTIQEWFGFNLYKIYFIKKAMILFGDKDTGKTQILNLLIKFLGEKNKAGISLQKISSGNKFDLSFLKDRYANIRDDLSSNDVIAGGEFKAATGGSFITGEHKFGDTFEFKTFAKHIFATNQIPKMKDEDDVYFSRWIPIPFDNPINKEKQDPFILQKITTEEEMSGLLNWALEGLDRLFKNNRFTFDKTEEEIKNLMKKDAEPLVAFVHDCLEQKDGNKITKEIMYQIYSKYCEIKEIPRLSKEQLGRRLPIHTNYILSKTGAKKRYWVNAEIKNTNIDTLDTFSKNLRDECINSSSNVDYIYKFSKKPSKPSKINNQQIKNTNIDTLDTTKQKQLKETMDFLKKQNYPKEMIKKYQEELDKSKEQ